jgi:hypothetical protein
MTTNTVDILAMLSVFIAPGDVVEVRAPKAHGNKSNTASGYFDNLEKCASAIARLDGKAPGIYFTLNPVDPDLMARASNRMEEWATYTTTDGDILKRRWLPLDFDAQRKSGISSTDAEHDAAICRMETVTAFLSDLGWPDPVKGDSGNGGHAVYRIDLPHDADAASLVQRVLQTLARLFDDEPDAKPRICLDTTVSNAGRIWKAYGTMAGKGDNTADRPHRRAQLLSWPDEPEAVSLEQLQELCALLGDEEKPPRNGAHQDSPGHITDFAAYLDSHNMGYREDAKRGARHFILDACPWEGHADHAMWAYQFPDERIVVGCSHNSCKGKRLPEFRDAVEPGWREQRKEEQAPPEEDETPGANGAHPGDDQTQGGQQEKKAPAFATRLSEVEIEDIQWLWHGYLALGKIAMADGEPGLGKSLVTLDLAARVVTGGRMPDGSVGLNTPDDVLIVCAEDGRSDTVVPRLMAAGASKEALARAWVVEMIPDTLDDGTVIERMFSLVNDLLALETQITETSTKLLIIDPVTAYLGSQTDMYKDSDIRAVLTPLAAMADRCRVAVLLVRHLSKGETNNAMNAGLGGIGFIGLARLGMLFVENQEKEGERLIGRHKGNIGKPPPTLGYRIKQVTEAENMVKVEWLGEQDIDIRDAFREGREKVGKLGLAMRFLREQLKDGTVPQDDLIKRAKSEGLSERTIRRAKDKMPVETKQEKKDGGGTHWVWTLIPDDDEEKR